MLGVAKKTALIRAKPLSSIFADGSPLDKFLLATLEGDQPVTRSNLMCIGATAEPWQQTAKAILLYDIHTFEPFGVAFAIPLFMVEPNIGNKFAKGIHVFQHGCPGIAMPTV